MLGLAWKRYEVIEKGEENIVVQVEERCFLPWYGLVDIHVALFEVTSTKLIE